jgi:Na+/proline symporter
MAAGVVAAPGVVGVVEVTDVVVGVVVLAAVVVVLVVVVVVVDEGVVAVVVVWAELREGDAADAMASAHASGAMKENFAVADLCARAEDRRVRS